MARWDDPNSGGASFSVTLGAAVPPPPPPPVLASQLGLVAAAAEVIPLFPGSMPKALCPYSWSLCAYLDWQGCSHSP